MEPMTKATCVFLIKEGRVMLAIHNKISTLLNRIVRNGYGGKSKPFERPQRCAEREVEKETGGIIVLQKDLIPVGEINFHNGIPRDSYTFPSMKVYFFTCHTYTGEPVDTTEMKDHALYSINDLPIASMMPGDELFVPSMLQGICMKGSITHTFDLKEVLHHTLTECNAKDLTFLK